MSRGAILARVAMMFLAISLMTATPQAGGKIPAERTKTLSLASLSPNGRQTSNNNKKK